MPKLLKNNLMPQLLKKNKLTQSILSKLHKMMILSQMSNNKFKQLLVITSLKTWTTKSFMDCAVQLLFFFWPSYLFATNAKIANRKLSTSIKIVRTQIANLQMKPRTIKSLKQLTWNTMKRRLKIHTSKRYQKRPLYMIANANKYYHRTHTLK